MAECRGVLGEYLLGQTLGKGQFSKVMVATKEGVKYAAKMMNMAKIPESERENVVGLLVAETSVMAQLDHPNIVKLYEFNDSGTLVKKSGEEIPVLYLILDLIKGGELFDYIVLGGRFSDSMTRYFFGQFLTALEYLHSKGYAHRDIKAENILMNDDAMLKLADFGFALNMAGRTGSGIMSSSKGTEGYMAPEIILGQGYTGDKVDIFAAGVVLFMMIAEKPPFNNAHLSDRLYKTLVQKPALFWTTFAKWVPAGIFSADFMDLVTRMLSMDPAARPSIAEIRAHPWMAGPLPTTTELRLDFTMRTKRVKMDQATKIEAAKAKRAAKKAEERKRGGGIAPHGAEIAVRSGMEEEKTVGYQAMKALKMYNVGVVGDNIYSSLRNWR